MRALTTAVLLAGLVTLWSQRLAGVPQGPGKADQRVLDQFSHSTAKQPLAYQAIRRLEASSARLRESAWMNAFTEYSPATGFRYRLLDQGGSERIRNRALKAVLESEGNGLAQWRLSALTAENYEFSFDSRTSDGLIKMQLTPRRQDVRLVNGAIWVSPQSGRLVRLQGRLSKSPSFWIKWVDVTRRYGVVHGVMMPIAVESTADVRVAGMSTLSMRYEYSAVDGHPITPPRLLGSR